MSIIHDLLNSGNTVTAYAPLIDKIGAVPAILYSNLLYLDSIFTENRVDGYFYTTHTQVRKFTGIKEHTQTRAYKKLKDINLIDCKMMGVPAKMYYKINADDGVLLRILGADFPASRVAKVAGLDSTTKKVNDINGLCTKQEITELPEWHSSNQVDNQSSTKTNKSIDKSTSKSDSSTTHKNNTNKLFSTPDVVGGIIIYLNNVLGTHFRNTDTNSKLIKKLFANKYAVDDIKFVIDNKFAEWHDNPKMAKYLRPSTLFRESNFDKYVNEPVFKKVSKWDNFGRGVSYHTTTKPTQANDDDVTGEKM
ncbi:hypothetical protein vBCtySFA88_00038 [Clostridium phage vB_CtyS-FA88]|nr:hypothetical protein vBCtySFA88_00038 [Clostridium phage vB_CtyS-FA88]